MADIATISCSIAKQCGGCTSIELPYKQQLADKQQRIEEMFGPLCTEVSAISPILGMENPCAYRNKIVSPFAPSGKASRLRSLARTGRAGKVSLRQEEILTGLYAAGSHRIVACDFCPVEHEVGRRVVKAIVRIMARYGIRPYDEDAGTGFMRHVMVRVGHESGEVLVTLVTNEEQFTGAKNFCRELVRSVPEVTTVMQSINTRQTNVILGQQERVLYGPGFILDTLCGLSFRISPHSFYQTNATQTEVLYSAALANSGILDAADSAFGNAPSLIIDAYCGTGAIGLAAAAASPGAQVIGVDSVASAIEDARQNARHNGIENARFVCEDAGFFMRECAAAGKKVGVVLLDPPRAGASEEFLRSLAALGPSQVVYISCNPQTQLRDCRVLLEAGYVLWSVQPVDMFPHTNHIENIACLVRAS